MALSLQIISQQRESLGSLATIEFDSRGGNIGRSADNDWVLPDDHRQLSGHHARIHCREGRYYLEDTSTNGVFADQGKRAIERNSLYALRDGEILRMGDYHLRVRIDAIALEQQQNISSWMSEQDELAATGTLPAPQITGLRFLSDEDIAPSLLLEELMSAQHKSLQEDLLPLPTPSVEQAQQLLIEHDKTLQLIDSRLSSNADRRGAFQSFCRGAGLDARHLPADAEGRMLLVAGQLLREAIMGVQELRRLQDHHPGAAEPQDILTAQSLATTEYLQDLLLRHANRDQDAVQRVREVFASLCDHQARLQAQNAPQ